MGKLIKVVGLLIAVLVLVSQFGGTSAQIIQPPTGPDGCPADIEAEVDAAVQDFADSRDNKVPGMTLAITRDGELLCTKACQSQEFSYACE